MGWDSAATLVHNADVNLGDNDWHDGYPVRGSGRMSCEVAGAAICISNLGSGGALADTVAVIN